MKKPLTLVSGLLRALVVSCPPFSIAPGTNHAKSCQRRRRNMPNHVRTPPGKHISINRHQTWQYTSLKQGQKLVTATSDAQITNACSAPSEAFYAPNMPNHSQDTTCQTNINNQASNMAAYPLKQSQKL